MKKATFYHAGCPICVDAESNILSALDQSSLDIEIVHLGKDKGKINAAESAGVKSVPALVIDDSVFHINFGASVSDLR